MLMPNLPILKIFNSPLLGHAPQLRTNDVLLQTNVSQTMGRQGLQNTARKRKNMRTQDFRSEEPF